MQDFGLGACLFFFVTIPSAALGQPMQYARLMHLAELCIMQGTILHHQFLSRTLH